MIYSAAPGSEEMKSQRYMRIPQSKSAMRQIGFSVASCTLPVEGNFAAPLFCLAVFYKMRHRRSGGSEWPRQFPVVRGSDKGGMGLERRLSGMPGRGCDVVMHDTSYCGGFKPGKTR